MSSSTSLSQDEGATSPLKPALQIQTTNTNNYRTFWLILTLVFFFIMIPILVQQKSSAAVSPSKQKSAMNVQSLDDYPSPSSGDQQQVVSSQPKQESTTTNSLFEFVSFLLNENLSPGEWNGMFNEQVLLFLTREEIENTFPCLDDQGKTWNMQKGIYDLVTVPPSCLRDIKSFTKALHYFLSVGLSRIALDKKMNELYESVSTKLDDNTSSSSSSISLKNAFEMKVAQMIVSYLQTANIGLQTWIDGFQSSPNEMFAEMRKRSQEMLDQQQRPPVATSQKAKFSSSSIAASWLRKRCKHITLFEFLPWKAQYPQNGRFWNNVRPTLSCSSLQRSCENPEGCRFLCNFEYSVEQQAFERKKSKKTAKVGKSKFLDGYQMVGFGSNNEYDWEDSMILAFERVGGEEESQVSAPLLGSISTFDCTLLTRQTNPGVRPSPIVKRIQDRFRFVPFCLSSVPNELDLDSTNDQDGQKVTPEIFASKIQGSISIAELRLVLDWKDGRKSISGDKARKINLFKYDIESFEFVSLSRWSQLELWQIFKQQKANSKKDNLIDFQIVPFLDVEQTQVELHRRGHKKDAAASPVGALWIYWTQLTHASLGLMPVVSEKNHFDNCCFEQVLVHYRFFTMSELWMLKRKVEFFV